MTLASFEIGTTVEGLVNVENIAADPLLPPQAMTRNADDFVELASGAVRGMGTGSVEWTFAYITYAQRAAFRALCPGASAQVYIQTRSLDAADTWLVYAATVVWPEAEQRDMRGYKRFVLTFRNLIIQGD